jgi:hypothetical protein
MSKYVLLDEISGSLKGDAGPVLNKHLGGKHDQASHAGGRRSVGSRATDALDALTEPFVAGRRREEENIDYLTGRTTTPPSWSGAPPTVYVPRRTMSDRIQSARKKIRARRAQRERERMMAMTPAEIDQVGRANRRRADAKRAARGKPPLYEDFEKHGSHDQSSHGRRGAGILTGDAAKEIAHARCGIGTPAEKPGSLDYPPYAASRIREQGFAEPSSVVSRDDFLALAKSGDYEVIFRGGPAGVSDGMITGEPWIGNGIGGTGSYFAPQAWAAIGYAKMTGDPDAEVVVALLPKAAVKGPKATDYSEDLRGIDSGADYSVARDLNSSLPSRIVYNTGILIFPDGPRSPQDAIDIARDTGLFSEDSLSGAEQALAKSADQLWRVTRDGRAVLVWPKSEQVEKHGNHDQSSHGRRGAGRRQSEEIGGAADTNVGFAGLTAATQRWVADEAAARGVSVRNVEREYERRIEVARTMPDPYRPGMTAYEGGLDWYSKEANSHAVEVGRGDAARGAAVISALSPQNPWPANKNAATAVADLADRRDELGLDTSDKAWAKWKEVHKEYGNTGPVTKPNFDQAWAVANGADINATLTGRKRRNFHNNILGDADSVTVDVHMMKALSTTPTSTLVGKKQAEDFWRWEKNNRKKAAKTGEPVIAVDGVGYTIAAQATINVARRMGLEPRQVQAIVWNTCVTEKWARPPAVEGSES